MQRPKPIESNFKKMAVEKPSEFIAWVNEGSMTPSGLTFAAEAVSLVKDSSIAVPCLFKLLNHAFAIVREGAVYGLEGHLNYEGVKERLNQIAKNDPSEGVREAASEALE